MEDLFGNPVEESVHDDAAEIKRNIADAKAFWNRMSLAYGDESPITVRAKEGYFKMKREYGV